MELKGNSEVFDIPASNPLCVQVTDVMSRNQTGRGFIGNTAKLEDLHLRFTMTNSAQFDFLRVVVFVDHQLYIGDDYARFFRSSSGSPSSWPYNIDNMKTVTILDDFVVPMSTYLYWEGYTTNGARPYFVQRSYNDLGIYLQFDQDFFLCSRNPILVYVLHDKPDEFGFQGQMSVTLRWKDVQ